MKKIILIFIVLLTIPCLCFAESKNGQKNTTDFIHFINTENNTIICDNNFTVRFAAAYINNLVYLDDMPIDVYSKKYRGLFHTNFSPIQVDGVLMELTNNSDQMLVIRWAESNISIGDFYGIPFLDGMKYANAGNPSATPDSIIPPKQTIKKPVYISRVKFYDNEWAVNGVFIPIDNSLKVQLYLKAIDSNNNSKYYSAISSPIGI